MSDIFGNIITGSEPEQAVIDILKKWFPTYIKEVELQINWTGADIPVPRSYTTRNIVEHFEDDQLPQCIVVSPGLAAPPKMSDGGKFNAVWSLGVGVVVSAKDEPTTKALARFYAAVVRSILIQHPSLDNKATSLEWIDESYDDIPDDAATRRILASGTCYFRIGMEDVGTWPGGPRNPMPPTPSGSPDPGETRWPTPDPVTQPGTPVQQVARTSVTLKREAL